MGMFQNKLEFRIWHDNSGYIDAQLPAEQRGYFLQRLPEGSGPVAAARGSLQARIAQPGVAQEPK